VKKKECDHYSKLRIDSAELLERAASETDADGHYRSEIERALLVLECVAKRMEMLLTHYEDKQT
jgi:hypothetical protein